MKVTAIAVCVGLLAVGSHGQTGVQPAIERVLNNIRVTADDLVVTSLDGQTSTSVAGLSSTLDTNGITGGQLSQAVGSLATAASAASTVQVALSNSVQTANTIATAGSAMAQSNMGVLNQVSNLANTNQATLSSTSSLAQSTSNLVAQISAIVSNQTDTLNTSSIFATDLSLAIGQVQALTASVSAQVAELNTTTHPKSCRHAKDLHTSGPLTNGMYLVQPEGFTEPYLVYCDMESYQGGWTLITKINAGNFFGNNPAINNAAQMLNMILDPNNDVNTQLLSGTNFANVPTNPSWFASLSRNHTNSLARYTKNDLNQNPIIRVDMVNVQNNGPNVQGAYFHQLTNAHVGMDYWQAVRDARYWANGTTSGYTVARFGTDFILTKNPTDFNASTNSFAHNNCGDTTFGFWSTWAGTIQGSPVSLTRHGGLIGDGHCNQGWSWIMTMDPRDGRFGRDDIRQSAIYIR
eukprot:m.164064 g.164064  ORF g.164064 m.164064 type:complete len:464 (-) comp12373_c0_seq1:259-1650(-)